MATLSLAYGMRTLSCGMWDLVSWIRIRLRLLHWEFRVLVTGPPGKSLMFAYVKGNIGHKIFVQFMYILLSYLYVNFAGHFIFFSILINNIVIYNFSRCTYTDCILVQEKISDVPLFLWENDTSLKSKVWVIIILLLMCMQ